MERHSASCPKWLCQRVIEAGGTIPFREYMDLVLNDPENGAYSSGVISIGATGDFVTSPSLGPEFATLLAVQISDWLVQLDQINETRLPLSLVEIGPGEGNLVFDLISELHRIIPNLLPKLEIIMVEKNEGMAIRQRDRLQGKFNIPIRWEKLEQLVINPVFGVVIANEVLDTLPVDRLVYKNQSLFQQGVQISNDKSDKSLSLCQLPLTPTIKEDILETSKSIGLSIPPEGVSDGWTTEWHTDANIFLEKLSKILIYGSLLVIDYALQATRYYNASRESGTIIAYKNQITSNNILIEPGLWDLTSHLCIDTLIYNAKKCNMDLLGIAKQGEALLALGLAEKLYSLQNYKNNQLNIALKSRESLLRLVDPVCLGEFRWIAFVIHSKPYSGEYMPLKCKFLK